MDKQNLKIPAACKAIEPLLRFSRTVELLTRFSVQTAQIPRGALQPGIIGKFISNRAFNPPAAAISIPYQHQAPTLLVKLLDELDKPQPVTLHKLP
jgi:hypothetical protein